MKYSRISRAESFPVSASKHSQSRTVSNGTRLIGNSTRRVSRISRLRALAISVLTQVTAHACGRKDEQELIVQADRLIDLLVEFLSRSDIMRRKPATHFTGL